MRPSSISTFAWIQAPVYTSANVPPTSARCVIAPDARVPGLDDVLRRRSVGAPAARSTLLTVLGEFLLSRPDGAWQEALIGALRLLGFTPSAARQAVVRSAREHWLEGERVGRRSRMRLTATSGELLRDGARRGYGFGGAVRGGGPLPAAVPG